MPTTIPPSPPSSRCSATTSARRSRRPTRSSPTCRRWPPRRPSARRLVEYARTWEGRPLFVLVIAVARADRRPRRGQGGLQRLADPRRSRPARGDRLVGELPVVTWLMHAVHGNEISSSDAALAEAYHLLAAQGDAVVDADPARDDRADRPAARTRMAARASSPRTCSAAPRCPTPSRLPPSTTSRGPAGASNHYLFDMNRDWFAQSQPETRGRLTRRSRVVPAGRGRSARDGRRVDVLLRAAGRSAQPAHHAASSGWFDTFGKANAARSTSAASPTSSARSTTPSIPGTASRGRSSRARSA